MMESVFTGAASGIVANETQKHLNKHVHGERDHEDIFHELRSIISTLHYDLQIISKHFAHIDELPVDKIITLQTDPNRFRIATLGRRYNMVFSPNNTTQITANIPGLGTLSFTPTIGWTELDFREGTELFLTTGTSQSLIFRCTNVPLGANVL